MTSPTVKLICIKATEYHKIGDIVKAKLIGMCVSEETIQHYYVIMITPNKSFSPGCDTYITLSEYRDKQINSILDET